MPYVDRKNRTCGFLDIEDAESGRFLRRYFILDTPANHLIWYMDNPQNLPRGAGAVGSLKLTYISKVSIAAAKQKSKPTHCLVINALSQKHFLQASDQKDLQGWVDALNAASKITVPRPGSAQTPEIGSTITGSQEKKSQTAYKTEIVGGVVVHTPISQNGSECPEVFQHEAVPHTTLRRSQSLMPQHVHHKPSSSVCALKSGYCVKQGNMRKNWKRRFFVLSSFNISYYKCETDREPLRCIHLREILKTHECLVKSGDLLMRDNLFEIITAPRTFYIQTDSPQEMHSWIKAINAAIQTLWTRCRDPFGRMSLHRTSIAASSPASVHSLPPCDAKRPLGKSMSIKSSWQPWTPVPKCEKESTGEVTLGGSKEGEFGVRARHMSEPQRLRDEPFLFNLDNINIRTSDV